VFTLVITGPDQAQARYAFEDREVTFGRVEDNHVVLADRNISRRHARLLVRDGRYILVDIKSTNGTYVNGRRLTAPVVVRTTDQIRMGEYTLVIEDAEREATQERPLAPFLPRDKVEADLLRAIGEGDQPSREVYADWLEDHGHAPEAEFVRVQQALVAMAPEADDFEPCSARLRELASTLDFRWRARVARPVIERCPTEIPRAPNVVFDFRCPKEWGNLAPTEREDRRFCGACKRHVHYCRTVPEARDHAARGECVALDIRALRWSRDVAPPYGEHVCTSCRSDVGDAADDCPRCGEPIRRPLMMLGRMG
jgi:uncharacterized protein (TIGR02996 family)